MENTNDIRHTEIKVTVKNSEDTLDAIKRYMKRQGFTYFESAQRGDYTHKGWYNNDYSDLWVGDRSYNEVTKKVTFTLEGNR
jgi:hypothetical protein